ncbi:MAG: beta-N-acetylhexosaminidase [Bacteroidia bacterium]|nr:MAG: beta-N-acetylhexosaminidase [Bacteroidia bacterium]
MTIRFLRPAYVSVFASLILFSCAPPRSFRTADSWAPPAPNTAWVEEALASMSLEEKAAQLVCVWTEGGYLAEESEAWKNLMRLAGERKIGGFIFSVGDVYEYAIQINRLQAAAKIPLLISADFEYGAGMRVRRTTTFPRAMGVGATRNSDFAYRMGKAIAREARALGVHQNYAPVVDVNNNPANPVINTRSFGDNPDLVAEMASAFIRGTQEERVIATVKHFPGHGDTNLDTHLDLPSLPFSRSRFDSLELVPFRKTFRDGVLSVMIAHIAASAFDSVSVIPATVSPSISTDLLRRDMGFRGLVVTDAMVMRGVSTKYHPAESIVLAVKAGADLILMPPDADLAIDAIVDAVRRGQLTESRLDESVRRVLAVKEWVGLAEERFVDLDEVGRVVASPDHVALAREIARSSITVLGNRSGLLPLGRMEKTVADLVITDQDDFAAGAPFHRHLTRRLGPLAELVLTPRSDSLDYRAALDSLLKVDVIVNQLHFYTRSGEMTGFAPERVRTLLNTLIDSGKTVIGVSFGNPYLVMDFPHIDTYVCAYSGSAIVIDATAEVMFGEEPARGKLPITLPGVYPYGAGVEYPKVALRRGEPDEAGFDAQALRQVDTLMRHAIQDSAFPGAQLAVVRNGILVHQKSYGAQTYALYSPLIDDTTLFDLASLTKVVATTTAVMRLVEEGKLRLDEPVASYVPEFGRNGKERITLKNLLVHNSGLPAWRKFYEFCETPECVMDSVFATALVYPTGDSTVYSDLGFMTLGKVIERVTGVRLNRYVDSVFFTPLGMTRTMFNPPVWRRSAIAPTEVDVTWKKTNQPVRGRVHDENAAVLGGVSGHAGLFSTARDLAVFMQMLQNGGVYGNKRYIREETVRLFTRRASPSSSRALGWDTRSEGRSFSGQYASPSTYLHTGFTGTSIISDPEKQLIVVLLTNRVHPSRNTSKIFDVRPRVHDVIYKAMKE